jgi:hypothetical protein
MMIADWAHYLIDGEAYYAPSLDFAFGLARARHPFKGQWTYEGRKNR